VSNPFSAHYKIWRLIPSAARTWMMGLPGSGFEFPWREAVAASLVIAGVAISFSGALSFRRAGTTVNPTKPGSTTSLVASGVYRMTRNRMYLGSLLMLTACAVFWREFRLSWCFLLLPFSSAASRSSRRSGLLTADVGC
jgi:protein-S-isoprenylcysteine O-methyltransferase Ste14